MKIRCIECYKSRPGGRCDYCPLHRKNRHKYRHVGDGWYVPAEEPVHPEHARGDEASAPGAQPPEHSDEREK